MDPPRHGVGREVRDSELFGEEEEDEIRPMATASAPRPSRPAVPKRRRTSDSPRLYGVGREVRDSELFGDEEEDAFRPVDSVSTPQPLRAVVPKRRRTASPPRRLPLEPEPPLRLLGRPGSSRMQPPPKRQKTELALRPPPRQGPDLSYLDNRAAAQRAGVVITRRALAESNAQFAPVPSRAGRSRDEFARHPDGVMRLAELCLNRAQSRVSQGRRVPFLAEIPDDFAFAILSAAGPDELVRLESQMPELLPMIEAVWARVVVKNYAVSELPDHIPSWRAFYEEMQVENAMRLQAAAERLRSRYHEGDEARQIRQVSNLHVPNGRRRGQPRNVARRRVYRDPDPTYQPPQNLLQRLRIQVQRERRSRR